ncbi:MAG TPA: HNH endonuclease signature motif containing protein [Ilumatobacter sp.]|nr:HNH endonuclease signature motif containing protein [Ilumatobacter sp.]
METATVERASDCSWEQMVEGFVVLADTDLDAQIRELELQLRQVEARHAAAVAVADQRRLYLNDGHRGIKTYLRATCNWPSVEADRFRHIATMVNWMPDVGQAWLSGQLGYAQVFEFSKVSKNRRVRHALPEFAPILLKKAIELPFDDFMICVQNFVNGADVDGAHQDRDTAIEHRHAHAVVNGSELDVGVVGGDPITATETVDIIRTFEDIEYDADVAERAAEHGDQAEHHDLPRTATQRRFDAFIALTRAARAHLDAQKSATPDATDATDGFANVRKAIGRKPGVVNVVIDHATYRRLLADAELLPSRVDINADLADWLGHPDDLMKRRCETAEGVPVHPHDVLRMLLDGHVRRVITNGRGVVTNMGRKQRLFSGLAREAAKLMIRRCQHPGCDLPAEFCEVDHNTEWSDGGTTDLDNANILCGHHNRWKHTNQSSTRQATNGHSYTVRADGTIILPVGATQPDFDDPTETQRQIHLARQRAGALANVA